MTLPFKLKYLFPGIVLCSGCSFLQPESHIPEDQADVIREILRENGYSIGKKEHVDNFLEFSSSNVEVDYRNRYYLLLPAQHKKTLVLSDKINLLESTGFMGVKTINYSFSDSAIDSIAFVSDSIIKFTYLYAANNNIKVIPKEIAHLRTGYLNLGTNQITALPDEIMQIFDENYFNGGRISLGNNRIDTLLLSDTMKTWLSKYAEYGSEWWKFQDNYSQSLQ